MLLRRAVDDVDPDEVLDNSQRLQALAIFVLDKRLHGAAGPLNRLLSVTR